MKILKLSWIVATLGNKNELEEIFISALNLSKEFDVKLQLIFCLPPKKKFYKKNIFKRENKNFEFLILNSSKKGQVLQRNFALKYSSYETILFTDDDIKVRPNEIYKLLKIKKSLPQNSVIGPKLIPYKKNLKPLYPDTMLIDMGFSKKFIKWFLNINYLGMGEATDLGIGCSFYKIEKNIFPVGWLAGAFTMHTKENLFLSDLYHWDGKAYAEDFFHSVSLRSKNINYFYVKNIKYKCDLTFSNNISFFEKFKEFSLNFIRIYQVQNKLYKNRINIKLILYFLLIGIYKLTSSKR